MPGAPSPPSAPGSTRASSIYLVLALTSAAFALLAAPQLMASAAMVNDRSLQGWETFVGMWLALPLVVLVPAAAILSLVGFVRGPQLLRMRLLAWWVVGAGGGSLALALAPKPGFNPYVGTPQPLAGLSDGLLALCLGLCVFFATWWYVQARRESRAA